MSSPAGGIVTQRQPSAGDPHVLDVLIDLIAERVAQRVIERLRAGDLDDYVDQTQSPLGRRRHIEAVRSGALTGKQVGRRYLARRGDVIAFLGAASTSANRNGARDADARLDGVDELAMRLGLASAQAADERRKKRTKV